MTIKAFNCIYHFSVTIASLSLSLCLLIWPSMAGMTVSCAKVKYFISIKDESVALKLKMCQMTRQKREIMIVSFFLLFR